MHFCYAFTHTQNFIDGYKKGQLNRGVEPRSQRRSVASGVLGCGSSWSILCSVLYRRAFCPADTSHDAKGQNIVFKRKSWDLISQMVFDRERQLNHWKLKRLVQEETPRVPLVFSQSFFMFLVYIGSSFLLYCRWQKRQEVCLMSRETSIFMHRSYLTQALGWQS